MLDKILKFLNYLSMILMISTRSQQDTGSFSRLGDKIRGKLNLCRARMFRDTPRDINLRILDYF